ncbi:MAG: rRNA pseudouridine synthase [Bacteroidales bacterium]|nr:rRNA pseudouridine synthase [Bacteroidales bacterium]
MKKADKTINKTQKSEKRGDFSKFINKKKKKDFKSSSKNPYKQDEKSKIYPLKRKPETFKNYPKDDGLIRLNRYLANAGICSRREADKLIESGVIKVNGKIVSELGTKVSSTDKIQYSGETLKREKKYYLLLNKPKGFITTTDDPYDRKTVMHLIKSACKERIYPVGRLDRNTTGLLLFTNDGQIAKKLTHPRHGIKKIYHIVLNRALSKIDILKIAQGIELEDGYIKVDNIDYVTGKNDKKQIGIEIHSGKNRIVRRIFDSLNYKVIRLDRVAFAGLTKKDIPRGKWRFLDEKEIYFLKMLP